MTIVRLLRLSIDGRHHAVGFREHRGILRLTVLEEFRHARKTAT
jgi:hypothetical protein